MDDWDEDEELGEITSIALGVLAGALAASVLVVAIAWYSATVAAQAVQAVRRKP